MLALNEWGAPLSPWAVVNTHPHREQIALQNLQRQKFHAYCPMLRRRRSHARRVTSVLRPLFPGYLFVSTGTNFGRWRPILSTYGVRSIVRSGQTIGCIDHDVHRSLARSRGRRRHRSPSVPYLVGQSVKIADGPFDGLVATSSTWTRRSAWSFCSIS